MAFATNSKFSVTWESYQANVCSGFSTFQQNGEFVDMTLAADGHVVKVHQALIALASPYLKEIIRSTPNNQHPVIYLNNVEYNTLCELLEYIYTGEVIVPMETFSKFLDVGRSLHIRGLENVVDHKQKLVTATSTQKEAITHNLKPMTVKSVSSTNKLSVPLTAKMVSITDPTPTTNISTTTPTENNESYDMETTFDDTAKDMDETQTDENQRLTRSTIATQSVHPSQKGRIEANVQFTVSNRGNLQMILNRFLYNVQSKSQKSTTRRWRCVDYRNLRCPAYVITKGSTVVNRGHPHNHGFHDKKILAKLDNKAVYTAIDDVTGVNEQNDDSTELD